VKQKRLFVNFKTQIANVKKDIKQYLLLKRFHDSNREQSLKKLQTQPGY
jgi:hypothetical protein